MIPIKMKYKNGFYVTDVLVYDFTYRDGSPFALCWLIEVRNWETLPVSDLEPII